MNNSHYADEKAETTEFKGRRILVTGGTRGSGTFDYNPVRYGLRKLSIEDQASGAAISSLRESNN